jgi:hypothetical protein
MRIARENRMCMPKQKTPQWISRQQLAAVGLALISHAPLVVQCTLCGVEWRPVRRRGVRWWRCHNGCHQ